VNIVLNGLNIEQLLHTVFIAVIKFNIGKTNKNNFKSITNRSFIDKTMCWKTLYHKCHIVVRKLYFCYRKRYTNNL